MRQATLVFLIKGDQILLAMKKRGFGAGWWNGVGGKPDKGETIEQTAVREAKEEISVTPLQLDERAILDFYFTGENKDWEQRVIVYLCSKWEGEPQESEEMRPSWFNKTEIPYSDMWVDDKEWLPLVIAGKYVEASFTFGPNNSIIKQKVITRAE